MRRFGPVRVFALAIVSSAILLVATAPASAATGDLTFKDCIAKFVSSPCTAVPSEVLDGGRDVAVSPNGGLVYVADYEDSVVGFTRSSTDGSLAYNGCVDSGSETGCTHVSTNLLLAPRSLAFSPDGSSLYVAAETSDTVLRFTVGAGGALTLAGCVEDSGLPDWGCATEVENLDNPLRVVVAPDGNAVYVISGDSTLSHFSSGLALQGCYREVVSTECTHQAEPFESPSAAGLAISPDGTHLYMTSVGRDAVAWFKRENGGSLTFAGCVADDDDATQFTDNCTEESGVNYDFMNHITISPNGSHAYVTDETGLGVVYHFSRDGTTGALTRQDCLADDLNTDAPGCAELDETTGTGLSSVTDAVVSSDSANLYTVAHQDSALSTFGLASPAGTMSFIRCLRANAFQGCSGFTNSNVLSGPLGIAASTDGHDIYVSNSSGTPAVLHFEREAPGTRTGGDPGGGDEEGSGGGSGGGGPGSGGGAGGDTSSKPVVKCGGKVATITGTPRAETLRGTKKSDVIAAGAGNDKVLGLAGADIVCGEGGNDNIDGGLGADLLFGGPGKDVLRGAGGKDRLVGGPGRNIVKQ